MKNVLCLFICGLSAILLFGCATSGAGGGAEPASQVIADYQTILDANPMPEGEKIQAIRVGGDEDITLSVVRFAPGAEVGPHIHKTHSETVYVIEGTGDMTMDGTSYQLKPGMIHFNPRTKIHATKNTGDGDLIFLQAFTPVWGEPDRVPVP